MPSTRDAGEVVGDPTEAALVVEGTTPKRRRLLLEELRYLEDEAAETRRQLEAADGELAQQEDRLAAAAQADGLYFGGGVYASYAETDDLRETDETTGFQVGYLLLDSNVFMFALELGAYDLGEYSENNVEVEAEHAIQFLHADRLATVTVGMHGTQWRHLCRAAAVGREPADSAGRADDGFGQCVPAAAGIATPGPLRRITAALAAGIGGLCLGHAAPSTG